MIFPHNAPMRLRKQDQDKGAVERLQRELRGRIARGLLLPGEQIRQEEVAEDFGVSRVPLREALNILADQGLLEHHHNRGYFVAKRMPEELYQLHCMLDLLETELIKSMDWPTKDEISELRSLNRQMAVLATRPDWTDMIALNRQFHFKVFGLSHYQLIFREVERLWTMTDVYIAGKLALPESRQRTIQEHEDILDALSARDRRALAVTTKVHRSNASEGIVPMGVPAAQRGARAGRLRAGAR
jgi:DNA-binding GntR family transcriptional regulator